jgi:hypothetical protein
VTQPGQFLLGVGLLLLLGDTLRGFIDLLDRVLP